MSPYKIQCPVCAWRLDCKKKDSVQSQGGRTICPDFTRDLTLPRDDQAEEKKMRLALRALLDQGLAAARAAGVLSSPDPDYEVSPPRQESHGDLASNLALVLAKPERKNPRQIAQIILDHLPENKLIDRTEIAGPGFINFFLSQAVWADVVNRVLEQGKAFGRSNLGADKKVQVEFVSANPTGPLHVGHGRGAAVGDVIASVLDAAGYDVEREYYINDAGRQMLLLGESVLARGREAAGKPFEMPEDGYQGEYIRDVAADLLAERPELFDLADKGEAVREIFKAAGKKILAIIADDLKVFGIDYQVWFSEREHLHESGRLNQILDDLRDRDIAYFKDGAWWYRTEAHGDEKDRVLVKANGDKTYFAADVGYHADKFARGFDWVIDVWGADHHGYIPRMQAAVEGMGYRQEQLTMKLVQLVTLLRRGQPVTMGKRSGQFITLREVVDEVGSDACRFIFLTRRSDTPLEFDLELAKTQSMDNPVYYVQYAHARICSIKRKAAEENLTVPGPGQADLSLLTEPEENALIRTMANFGEMIDGAARDLEVHRITYYLTELASRFHSYYNVSRVITDDRPLSLARLALVEAAAQVIANGLNLLGVSAPEEMIREDEE